jgi:hypothetical protein
VGLLHLAVAVCIGGAAVAQAPNFLSAAPAASFPAEIAANASDGLLSLAGGYKGEPMGPALPPMSTALLGIVNAPMASGAAAATQGDGSLANPYIKVQAPGFDKNYAAASSPWKYLKWTNNACGPVVPVQIITTDRRHARLQPFYGDMNGNCSNGLNCGQGLQPIEVAMIQGLINAGDCAYGSLAFDVRVLVNTEPVCGNPAYLEAKVTEWDSKTGWPTMEHVLRIDRQMFLHLGLQAWKRMTFHFALQNPGSLLNLEFRLIRANCTSVNSPGRAYPATVDIDNVALDTIPSVKRGPKGQIVSGCRSGSGECPVGIFPNPTVVLEGLAMTLAPHDQFAQHSCPQSYCEADTNFDGIVDSFDLGNLLSAWGSLPAVPVLCNTRFPDLNGDGQVDSADLAILLSAWGPCP